MPEVRCPTGSDENWQRVDDERGEEWEPRKGQGDQDGGFWLKRERGERVSVALRHSVSTSNHSKILGYFAKGLRRPIDLIFWIRGRS